MSKITRQEHYREVGKAFADAFETYGKTYRSKSERNRVEALKERDGLIEGIIDASNKTQIVEEQQLELPPHDH